jgi:hypothetical protein
MSRDPEGKAALFGVPAADPESEPPRQDIGDGPVLVMCSECGAAARTSYRDLAGRLLRISLWNPQREHAHWMRCPACDRRNWCRVSL